MSTFTDNRLDPSLLEPGELEELAEALSAGGSVSIGSSGKRADLPEPISDQLRRIVRLMSEGSTVFTLSENQALTSQAAAEYLDVSRQHMVNLMEDGEIPFHKVGTHRRVYLKDLLVYERRRDAERRRVLDQLFDEVEAAGLYDATYTGDHS